MRRRAVSLALAAIVAATGCANTEGGRDSDTPRGLLTVAVSAYPLAWLVESVGGDRIQVVELLAATSDLHDAELQPEGIERLGSSDIVVLLGSGLQPGIDDALASRGVDEARILRILDRLVATGAAERRDTGSTSGQSHFWLDPVSMANAASLVASALSDANPENREFFQENRNGLDTRLSNLDQAFERTLQTCRSRTLIVYHSAYGSMASRYRLDEVAVTGTDPEAEPKPSDIRRAVEAARKSGVRMVFSDPEAGKEAMKQVAVEAGVDVEILDPIETRVPGSEYDARMYSNLSKITAGLGCG